MDLTFASLSEISEAVKNRSISAKEVTLHFLKRIENLNPKLNAFTSLNPQAVQEAEAVDARIANGEDVGLLAGVPFGIKEMFCTKGLTTTAGSKILENFVPPYDATAVARLKKSGIVVMGKLNQDEFAMGSSNETSFHGVVKNPWDLERVPGGSSGGSAAAQASRLVAGTLGTDTGGSIRQPASFCGIVGVKPTYGRVSRYGIVAYASSLDQAGPMVSSVRDAALTLEVISGFDPQDSTTTQKQVPAWSQNLKADVKGMKIGLMKEYMTGALDPDVQKTVENSVDTLKQLGAEIVEVSVPMTAFAVPVYYLVAASEASSNLSRYDGVKYGYRAEFKNLSAVDLEEFYSQTRGQAFGAEVKRRIMLGTYCLSSGYYDAFYNKAGQVRRLIMEQYLEAFKKCDVILSPVTTAPAFKIGERVSDPLAMYLNDIFTTSTNLAGLPGMSVPFGQSQSGLPIGIQLTAGHFEEQKMLNVAFALEGASLVKGKHPHVI
ncbi:Asp-tRNA(Asn)/Glu-tRNA(Gln) amidotransferase subunit GatA [Bdellovibrio bacteriovorus]|uniref:Asp-tRNA(Asn)/Glu-tRNA(Gln) amidotransferase subunit GatA n=1 Tax=Bdellovibrio bacteriovorus TaxID=959 RepID=UPI00045C1A43|nr:Asp-tRNA(Asn)/Glu-tRNA(Gln) amidotransferase subunit GatA [Bdellovibrio bacteriovorus]AHZ85716.1 glutamyl-tRNA amidotransferase [Bdellovibrio bacteriovorus]BEV66635.1 Glutamyl-tRNA(Gln) amidotransferase subunit A [Bdellovibrio bacteriovorus]